MLAPSNMIMLVKVEAILAEIEGVVSQSNVTQWELGFLRGLVADQVFFGSPKQNKIVNEIWKRIFKDAD